MYTIQPEDKEVVEEFKRNPIGQHSPRLRRVLNLFRRAPGTARYVLVCTKPHKEWVLGQLTGERGAPICMTNQVFNAIEDAEWHAFKQRWKYYTGENLDEN